MDLTILFNPIDEAIYSDISSLSSVFKNIKVFGESMPGYKTAQIAIFGIGEERGTGAKKSRTHCAQTSAPRLRVARRRIARNEPNQ